MVVVVTIAVIFYAGVLWRDFTSTKKAKCLGKVN